LRKAASKTPKAKIKKKENANRTSPDPLERNRKKDSLEILYIH
jgi:hypothetical protein